MLTNSRLDRKLHILDLTLLLSADVFSKNTLRRFRLQVLLDLLHVREQFDVVCVLLHQLSLD